jgi:hypothetical protein
MRSIFITLTAVTLAACAAPAPQRATTAAPPHAVVGVEEGQLDADYWIARQPHASRTILDAAAIDAQNRRLVEHDRSVHDLAALPAQLPRATIAEWVNELSSRPDKPLYDERGEPVPAATLDALVADANAAAIPATTTVTWGLVVQRADLRAFPTRLRVFTSRGDTDIDRFQESALFPGTPVALVHASRDGRWWFVASPLYAAWIEKDRVATGDKADVLGYGAKTPYLVVTGTAARTVHTPERPDVSELQLDMGVRVPVLANWPADRAVNGQHPYTSHVIELPARDAAGRLEFVPALLPKTADTTDGYLPLTASHLLRQGFKFLGERYGWGHSYNARDCSGFVSEIYRSFGVTLPRNTRDMAVSPALNRLAFGENDDHAARLAALRSLEAGDLVFIPGHVMMVIGHVDGEPYVIHDTTGISYRNASGELTRVPLNAVSVSPLTPLLASENATYVDRIYSVQRIRK